MTPHAAAYVGPQSSITSGVLSQRCIEAMFTARTSIADARRGASFPGFFALSDAYSVESRSTLVELGEDAGAYEQGDGVATDGLAATRARCSIGHAGSPGSICPDAPVRQGALAVLAYSRCVDLD
jgi:hypothetical protein